MRFYCLFLLCGVVYVHAYGIEPVINFVTDANGSIALVDNTAAFHAGAELASSSGYPLYIPPGIYNFTQPINSSNIVVRGAGQTVSIFQWTEQLGFGEAAYKVVGSYAQVWHLGLQTIFVPKLGEYNANFYGIKQSNSNQIVNIKAQYFYAGVVWSSGSGHTVSQYIHSTNNYYGLYVEASNGDNFMSLSNLAGNTFASVAAPPVIQIGAGDAFWRVQMCASPYGVYQEALNRTIYNVSENYYSQFLADAHFQLARFEDCGNGAFFTENAGTSVYGGVSNIEIYNVGFTWNSSYMIPSRPAYYGLDVGTTQSQVYYFPGKYPFTGAKKSLELNQANQWGLMWGFNTSVVYPPSPLPTISPTPPPTPKPTFYPSVPPTPNPSLSTSTHTTSSSFTSTPTSATTSSSTHGSTSSSTHGTTLSTATSIPTTATTVSSTHSSTSTS